MVIDLKNDFLYIFHKRLISAFRLRQPLNKPVLDLNFQFMFIWRVEHSLLRG